MDYTKMFDAPRIMVTVVGGLLLAAFIYTQFIMIMPSPDPEYLKVLQTGPSCRSSKTPATSISE